MNPSDVVDARHAIALDRYRERGHTFADRGAVLVAQTGECLRRLDRIGVPIGWAVRSGENIARYFRRDGPDRGVVGQEVELQAQRLLGRDECTDDVDLGRRAGESQIAGPAILDIGAQRFGQLTPHRDRGARQRQLGGVASRLAYAAESPARRHRCDAVLLDQRDGVAFARQFSGRGGAGNSAADDDDAKHGRSTWLSVFASGCALFPRIGGEAIRVL